DSSYRYGSDYTPRSAYAKRLQYSVSRETAGTTSLQYGEMEIGRRKSSTRDNTSVIWRALKTVKAWLWLDDSDDDEEFEVERRIDPEKLYPTIPPPLATLVQETQFDPKWITFLYRNFKQRAPNGRMSKSEWRQLMMTLFPRSVGTTYSDKIFAYLSAPKGFITFEALLRFIHSLSTDDQALSKFVFALLEPDAAGRVTQQAFADYVHAVFLLRDGQRLDENGNGQIQPLPLRAIRMFAAARFKELDTDNDGFVVYDDVQKLLADLRMSSLLNSVLPTAPRTPAQTSIDLGSAFARLNV
ncbi:ncs-6, partial [Pristionchus pacificus]